MSVVKTLLRRADHCVRQSTWKDLALIKLCLAALGMLLGLAVSPRKRKPATLAAGLIFVPTYLLLLARYLPLLLWAGTEEPED